MMFGFVIGALVGSAAAYFWHDRIRGYVDTQLPAMRDRAVEQLGTLGQRAGEALDQAKSRLDSTVRSSQERLRTARSGSESEGASRPGSPYAAGERPRRRSGPGSIEG